VAHRIQGNACIYQLIIEDIEKNTDEEMQRASHMGRGTKLQGISLCSAIQKLSEACTFAFL
jgi:hypothetical protein